MSSEKWAYTTDEEDSEIWNDVGTREETIVEGMHCAKIEALESGMPPNLWIGKVIPAPIPRIDTGQLITLLQEAAWEVCEGSEFWLDTIDEILERDIEAEINDAIKRVLERHNRLPTWFMVDDIEKIDVSRET